MKLKKLAAICKQKKRIIIFNRYNERGTEVEQQYLSDGTAVYPIYGLPQLDKEAVLTIFDIEPAKWEEWFVSEKTMATSDYVNVEDVDETEIPIRHLYPPVIYHDTQLMLCGLEGGGTMFIDADYLGPVDGDSKEFYVRQNEKGTCYLAVKTGLLLQAVILPHTFMDVDQLSDLGREFSHLGFSIGKMVERERSDTQEQMAI